MEILQSLLLFYDNDFISNGQEQFENILKDLNSLNKGIEYVDNQYMYK